MTNSKALAVVGDRRRELILEQVNRDPRLRSENSRRGYIHDLAAFDAWRGERPITKLLVEQYAAELQRKGAKANSINRALSAVRWWARRVEELAADDPSLSRERREMVVAQVHRVGEVGDVRAGDAKKGRHLAREELDALLAVCRRDHSPAGRRDLALFLVGWYTGARRSEIAGLRLEHLTWSGEECDLTLYGKGQKIRSAYVQSEAAKALRDWLKWRGDAPGFVFCPVRKSGQIAVGAGITGKALELILAKRREAAKVAPMTWHDFRRTFAGELLDLGTDMVTVQSLMGHASPATTAGYDRRPENRRREAVRALHGR